MLRAAALVALLLLASTAAALPHHRRPHQVHDQPPLVPVAPVARDTLHEATRVAADLRLLDRHDPGAVDEAWFTAMRTTMWTVFLVTNLRDALPSAQPVDEPPSRPGALLEPLTPPWTRRVLQDLEPVVVPAPPALAPAPPETRPVLREVEAAATAFPLVVLPSLAPPAVDAPDVDPPSAPPAPAGPDVVAPAPPVAAPDAPSCVVAGDVAVGVTCLHLGLVATAGARDGALASAAPRLSSTDEGVPGARAEEPTPPPRWSAGLREGAGDGAGGSGPEPLPPSGAAAPPPGPSDPWGSPALLSLSAAALLLPFLVLYRRVVRETALRNDLRRRLLGRICAEPGITIDRLARAEGVAYQTVQHHVRVLHELRFLEPWRDGARVHLFENGGRYGPEEKRRLVSARRAGARVLREVQARPGASPSELAQALGVSRGTVRFHLDRLAQRGLVRLERGGRCAAFPADGSPSAA